MEAKAEGEPLLALWPEGFAGMVGGRMFGYLPDWVDPKKPPGHTSQVGQASLLAQLRSIATGAYLFFSPNLIWLAVAVVVQILFPYDITASTFTSSWLLPRFVVNYLVAFAYYFFFFYYLYMAKPASSTRKFRPNSYPTVGNMLHNLWYWSLGVVQWTWWEAVMVRLWATGALGFVTLSDMMADWRLLCINVVAVLAVPVVRDVHFYVAHHFLHVRSIFTYVHKLHHRNTDPEPFSGMTMHPIEHLYYFSNAFTPALYFGCFSPFVFLWNFVHLAISPAASHSGWEDHFQSDQYHYVHHAKFECNYGSPNGAFVDLAMGTFREVLGESQSYKGEWRDTAGDDGSAAATKKDDDAKSKEQARPWAPQSYLGLPASWDHAVYTVFWILLFSVAWIASSRALPLPRAIGPVPLAEAVAFLVSYGPIAMGLLLSRAAGDRMSWRWPFQKERVFGSFGFFILLAWALALHPVYIATLWSVRMA